MARQHREQAWLLHTRKYTDTRILIDFLSERGCLLSGVFRYSGKNPLPQMFKPYSLIWSGNKELKSIKNLEESVGDIGNSFYSACSKKQLKGKALYCGLYMNELLIRVLARDDPHDELFESYESVLPCLFENSGKNLEPALRNFELGLLQSLGYGLDFKFDTDGEPIRASEDVYYEFHFDEGFRKAVPRVNMLALSGMVLSAIFMKDYSSLNTRRAAKYLCRYCLDKVLGGKKLNSRELFRGE